MRKEIEQHIQGLSDVELLEYIKSEDYSPEAIEFAKQELLKRGLPPLPPNVNPAVPWCATIMSEITVDSIEIQKVGEVLVPTAANIRQYEKFEDGQFTELISTHKRTNINFDPDFEAMGAFEIDVPDGTPVYFHDERGITGIKYEMVDGQVRAADSEG